MSHDFSSKNIRGISFRNQDLTRTNFNHANIRGVNFTHANIRGANFSNIEAGQQYRWIVSIAIIVSILSAIFGCSAGYAGAWVSSFITGVYYPEYFFIIIIASAILTFIFILTLKQGIGIALGTLTLIITVFISTIIPLDYISNTVIGIVNVQFLLISILFSDTIMIAIIVAVTYLKFRKIGVYCIGIIALASSIPGALEAVYGEIMPTSSTKIQISAVILGEIITIILLVLSI